MNTHMIAPILILATLVSSQFAYSQQHIPREVVGALREARTATLVVMDQQLMDAARALVGNDGISDYDLNIISPALFGTDPQNGAWARSMLGVSDLWFIVDAKGQFVTKGRDLPTPEDLRQTLVQRGILPTQQYLRNFLRLNPDNQEARAELLNLLHSRAVEQTMRSLNIRPEPEKTEQRLDTTATQWTGQAIEKPASNPEMLGAENDLIIWAQFAQELDSLFSDSSWMAASLNFTGYLAEAHSPTMQVVYGRHLNAIQDTLLQMPSRYQLWELWVRFKGILPQKPATAFLRDIVPLPQELSGGSSLLSPRVVTLLMEDARRYDDWVFVRELLLAQFEKEFPADAPTPQQRQQRDEKANAIHTADSLGMYQNFIEPLIEALVSSNRENLVPDIIYRFTNRRGEIPNLATHLTDLARRLDKADYASSWIRISQ